MEMGARFTSKAKFGFMAILNYVGGAYIYIRREYAVRIKIINKSWRTANNKAADFMDAGVEDEEGEAKEGEGAEANEGGAQEKQAEATKNEAEAALARASASGEAQNKNTNNMKAANSWFGSLRF